MFQLNYYEGAYTYYVENLQRIDSLTMFMHINFTYYN
jgi:hypothetical protein